MTRQETEIRAELYGIVNLLFENQFPVASSAQPEVLYTMTSKTCSAKECVSRVSQCDLCLTSHGYTYLA